MAYPVGGPSNSEFILLEIHYDNPQVLAGDHIVKVLLGTLNNICIHDLLKLLFSQGLLTVLAWNFSTLIRLLDIVLG